MTYFPDFNFNHSVTAGYSVWSNLRKKHRGKWYLILVKTYGHTPDIALHRFLKEIYAAALFTKIDPDRLEASVFGGTEEKVFPLDELQIEETERIEKPMI